MSNQWEQENAKIRERDEARQRELINTITGEPWQDEYSRNKALEVWGNNSYYSKPATGESKLEQWQVDQINLKRVDTDAFDQMMKKLGQEHKEKQAQAIANNLKGRSI